MNRKLLYEIIQNRLADRKCTAEELLQLDKITKLEEPFIKSLTKEQFEQYFDLDIEKGNITLLELDCLINLFLDLLI